MALLRTLDGPSVTFSLQPVTRLGRGRGNTIALDDHLASRRHAEIRLAQDGSWRLADLGSRHGTRLGGQAVRSARLSDGDVIELGATRLRFEQTGQSGPMRAAPPERPARPRRDTPPPSDGAIELTDEGPAYTGEWVSIPATIRFPPASLNADQEGLRRDYERLRAAYELSEEISAERRIEPLLRRTLDKTLSLLNADRGVILLFDPRDGAADLHVTHQHARGAGTIHVSRSIVREVVRRQAAVITGDAGLDERFRDAGSVTGAGIRSAMCVPLAWRGDLLGVMQVDSLVAVNLFHRQDLEAFSIIATQAALAIKNLGLLQEMTAMEARQRLRLERLFDDLPDGLALLDAQHHLVRANPRGRTLLTALAGPESVEHPEALAQRPLGELLRRADEQGTVELEASGPPELTVVLSAVPLAFDETMADHILLVMRDLTQQREQERRLARSERLATMGEMIGGLAHDFNNLLGVITSYAELAQERLAPTDAVRADLGQIETAAARATQLVRRLLTFSARSTVRPEIVDPNRCLADLEPLLLRTLDDRIAYAAVLALEPWHVRVDPNGLERVLMNLVLNARDAMDEGGELRIETANLLLERPAASLLGTVPAGRYVRLTVSDTGRGMTREQLGHLFEPFYTTKVRGTGLGLATVYGLLRQAGASVRVESHPGAGTRFDLLFPACDAPTCVVTAAPDAAPPSSPREGLLLLAEDDDALRALLERAFRRAGHRVLTAPSVPELLEAAAGSREPVALLVTDVLMPDMSGPELARALRQRQPDLAVLYLSGGTVALDAEALRPSDRVLTKPFSPSVLLHTVQTLLGPRAPWGGSAAPP